MLKLETVRDILSPLQDTPGMTDVIEQLITADAETPAPEDMSERVAELETAVTAANEETERVRREMEDKIKRLFFGELPADGEKQEEAKEDDMPGETETVDLAEAFSVN